MATDFTHRFQWRCIMAGALAISAIPALGAGFSRNGRPTVGADSVSHTIYISPSGNDHNPGTSSKPLRTLVGARNKVRTMNHAMSADITVVMQGGIYRLASTLQLGPQDSGSNGHSVVWMSAPGQTAVIAGSDKIGGWKRVGSSHMWRASVPGNLNTRQIYVNGQRATLASGPAPVRLTETTTGYEASAATMSKWRNPTQIDFVYTAQLGLMVEPICPVARIHGKAITMAEPCWRNSNDREDNLVGFGKLGQPSYVQDTFELLTKPGQFYLDHAKRTLYYIPFAGQNMKTADVEAPRLQVLVSGAGTPGSPVHDINFSNVQFAYATWLQPGTPVGFSDMQDGYTVTGSHGFATQGLCSIAPHGSCPYGNWTKEPGNLTFRYDHSIHFVGDEFVHLGGAGLNFDDGSQNDTVSGSVFTDISGNGLQIGGVDMPTAGTASQTTGVQVADNHLYGLPVEYHGGVAVWVGYANHTTIAHNQIDHVPYSAISIGWGGWPDKRGLPTVANNSQDNVISDNRIFDFMETLSDGGGVYTLGLTGPSVASGEKVLGNVIYNQMAWGRALQSDDGATNVSYKSNALYDDNYDWGTTHVDFRHHQNAQCVSSPSPTDCTYDATTVTGNYWQQADPRTNIGVTVKGNTLISGSGGVPAAILSNAGIQSSGRSVLAWVPAGENYPNAPYSVSALYAFGGKAWVTWRPSYAYGHSPVSSYTVSACTVGGNLTPSNCHAATAVTISQSAYINRGYAVIAGLKEGTRYSFTVTANSATGSSTASIPSAPAAEIAQGAPAPDAPKSLDARGGDHLVRLIWYAPPGSATNAALGYTVMENGGSRHSVTGLRPLIVANSGGRVVDVVSGLTPGRSYTFTVAAFSPSGTGPAATFPETAPTN